MVDFSRYLVEWVKIDEINAQDDVFQCRAKADEKAVVAMMGPPRSPFRYAVCVYATGFYK